jgi:dTDP-4-amino-4,6-dideoxygalactose transaminase
MTKKMEIPFSLPLIGEEEIAEVVDTLRTGWMTTGPKVKRFEAEFAEYVGAKHVVAVNSCTAALHLALDAVGVGRDDIVLTTPMTFAATAEVIRYFEARPLFADIDESTHNISPDEVERVIESLTDDERGRLKAIIPVHMAGQPCDMDRLMDIADRYGLKVIEDAAHTLPASYKGRNIGTIGDITAFSFYATKCITTGEGGMATTDNDEYADKMRVMSLHGISKDAWKRYTKEGSWYYEITAPGYKYNMPDIMGAIGIHQLAKADQLHEMRIKQAELYDAAFGGMPEIELPGTIDGVVHSRHLYVIKLNLDTLRIGRSAFIEELRKMGVYASVHFMPLHIHPYYRDTYGYSPSDYPVAASVYERSISLPLYPKMTSEETEYVVECVEDVIEKHRS